ncbi:hypothetical protein WBP07_22220 (plasmid) [Novosphingobium sp. BL-8A]|uniref:hypothetical protein n=1 Tax=Novosphingobium sp. BL-8A TaxID=3127639 RepID=UPI00375804EE
MLAALVAGCTTAGTGYGQPRGLGGPNATFTWQAQSARSGTMNASLSDGSSYSGPFFQVTRETRVDELAPLWVGWGPGIGPGWGPRRGWGGSWDYWRPTQSVITHYSGRVLANLEGPSGHMRCRFTLMRPSSGMSGGGEGQCQLPAGTRLDARFPPR